MGDMGWRVKGREERTEEEGEEEMNVLSTAAVYLFYICSQLNGTVHTFIFNVCVLRVGCRAV